MRRLVLALTGALLGAMLVMTPAAAEGTESSWIVTLVDGADPSAEASGLAQRHGGRAGHVYEHALSGFQFVGSAQAASNLARSPRVRSVVPDGVVQAVAESLPTGVSRIDGDDAHTAGKRGSGAVVAVIDTGIDLNHPDLAANIQSGLGKDCINNDAVANDDHGHGTHVAGTIAAIDNTDGVIGVAPLAKLVPVKVLDASGSGAWSDVICGIDFVTANAGTIQVANMSLGGSGSASSCTDGGMHQAICSAVGAGVTFVVAAGNDAKNASTFVPAAYPEAVTVSAFSDTNGNSTKQACSGFGPWLTCDEVFASFSNYGAIVDVMAPGVNISSTVIDGYGSKSGTSMAAPHVAGVAALVKAANPLATPAQVASHLKATGECPNTLVNGSGGATCSGQGTWSGDPDGIAEPLVNANRAATIALGSGSTPGDTTAPTVSITSPAEGAAVSGTVSITANASDNVGVSRVDFRVGGSLIGTDTSSPYSQSWDTNTVSDGLHTVSATAVDAAGNSAVASITVTVDNISDPPPSGITLSARAYKVKGLQRADLTWSGAAGGNVDVYRNGVLLVTTPNDGSHTDNIGKKGGGSYTYKVCDAGTSTCSNEATVTF